MSEITQEQLAEIRSRQVKAATAGFVQSLINNGYSPEIAKQASVVYASEGGLLHKRAANIQALTNSVLEKVAAMRAAK